MGERFPLKFARDDLTRMKLHEFSGFIGNYPPF
jgi:hypothetical protein